MKKVIAIIICVLIIVPVLAFGGIYLALSNQYAKTFMPGMFINSVYVADLTPQQVNEQLVASTELPDFEIVNKDGESFNFSLSEIGYQADYMEELASIQNEQTVIGFMKWFMDSSSNKSISYDLKPSFSYDNNKLLTYLDKQSYLKDDSSMTGKKIEVKYDTYKGYILEDNTQNMLKHEAAEQAITKALDAGIYSVDLKKEKCYVEPKLTPAMKDAITLWKELEPFMKSEITYKFGNSEKKITSSQTSKFLAKDEETEELLRDEDGKLYLDEKLVKEFVHEMAEEYNTVNKPRTFKSTRGDMITIKTGTYGSIIDEKAEREYLLTALKFGRVEEHRPEYSQTTFSGLDGLDDIGDTYIEVDMTNQTMYYYVNGHIKLETPVVTGNTSLGRGTPEKVCYVYMKQRNRTLRGEGYASFVNYWMPVWRGVGIHDASWRGKYGGTIYKTAGSHGCINTPKNIVSQLYDMVEIGTPVLLYY